jgi:ATP-dependent RNA helicase RhlE
MVPTRELALQITKVFRELGAHTRVETACLIGGVEDKIQIEAIQRGARILITTPGRMFDLHHRGILTFEDTKILVLDEADQMLALGFYKDIKDGLTPAVLKNAQREYNAARRRLRAA